MNRPLVVASLPIKSINDLEKLDEITDADFIELRLDYLKSLKEVDLNTLEKYKSKLIITIRDINEGGINKIEDVEKLSFLKYANQKGFLYDVELEFVKKYDIPYKSKIISVHYFRDLPNFNLLKNEIEKYSKDVLFFKIAVIAKPGYKSLLANLLEISDNVVVIPMSENPLERIAFGILGSRLLYGFVTEPTAKGQLMYREIVKIINELFKYKF
ncbi:MAG: type I 3-dehydroquinate dehydratase [Sulfolobaceae archaeon]